MPRNNRRFTMSQNAHKRLSGKWRAKGNSPKNRALSNYHADCFNTQGRIKRRLAYSERAKLYKAWWADEVSGKKVSFPQFSR